MATDHPPRRQVVLKALEPKPMETLSLSSADQWFGFIAFLQLSKDKRKQPDKEMRCGNIYHHMKLGTTHPLKHVMSPPPTQFP